MPQLEDLQRGADVVAAKLPELPNGLLECWKHEARIAMRTRSGSELQLAYQSNHQMGQLHVWWQAAANAEEPSVDLTLAIAAEALERFFDRADTRRSRGRSSKEAAEIDAAEDGLFGETWRPSCRTGQGHPARPAERPAECIGDCLRTGSLSAA